MNKSRVAAVVAPIGIALMPKCPLCLLPILAAIGIAVPASWVLSAFVAAIALAWLALLLRVARSHNSRLLGVVATLLVVTGHVPFGVALMIVVAMMRLRECRATCVSTAAPSTEPCARGRALAPPPHVRPDGA